MDVKEIALRVAEKYRAPQGHIEMSAQVFINEVEALIAEIQKQNEPVAWMSSRNGFICKENKNPEYNVGLFTFPPSTEGIETLRARVAELEADKELVAMWQAQADDRAIIQAAIASTEQVEERINLSVRACLNVSTNDLRVAANARLDGLLKFKRSFDEQLAEKDQRIAELEEQYDLAVGVTNSSLDVVSELRTQLAAQALTIKTMREVIRGMSFGADWNNGTHAKIYRNKLLSFLALPDNSTEVLQEWLDKQFGEPVSRVTVQTGGHPFSAVISDELVVGTKLYRKPEIK